MKAIAERIAAEHDVRVEVHGSFNRPPKPIDDGAAPCSRPSARPAPIWA